MRVGVRGLLRARGEEGSSGMAVTACEGGAQWVSERVTLRISRSISAESTMVGLEVLKYLGRGGRRW